MRILNGLECKEGNAKDECHQQTESQLCLVSFADADLTPPYCRAACYENECVRQREVQRRSASWRPCTWSHGREVEIGEQEICEKRCFGCDDQYHSQSTGRTSVRVGDWEIVKQCTCCHGYDSTGSSLE